MTLPDDTQRLAIVGKTGTGKTQAAVWHLAQRDFDVMPWIIIDFKGDALIGEIGATEISLTDSIPTEPGLYIVHPIVDDVEGLEAFLWKIWSSGYIGLYIDEGYMINPRSGAFNAILTQGRSKHIPVIMLSQRPTWVSRFVFSEAEFYMIFHLNDENDQKRVTQFMPSRKLEKLPRYQSYYYDVGEDKLITLKPVPKKQAILAQFDAKLKAMQYRAGVEPKRHII